jgi:surface-adhesin protein E
MNSYRLSTILLVLPALAAAQGRWKEIGKTSSGNSVYVDPRSVKKVNGIITARVRVKFDPPVKAQQKTWETSQTVAMFDCAKSSIAAKETIYYADEKAGKIAERKVNAQPGFGPALGGSMGKLALDYLCAPAPPK